MKLFIFLLIINLIMVVFYLIWNYIRRKEKYQRYFILFIEEYYGFEDLYFQWYNK